MSIHPGGCGPWFVALLFNTSTECKKQTHLICHTYPHLAIDVLNKTTGQWVIILKVGPFCDWKCGLAYLEEWTIHTRGRVHRLDRGIELYVKYKDILQLSMWALYKTREECLLEFKTRQYVPVPMRQLITNKPPVRKRCEEEEAFLQGDREKLNVGTIKKLKFIP